MLHRKFHKVFFSLLFILILSVFSTPSHALLLTGTDWNGMDLTPSNGDVLSGTFTNVRSFQIDSGDIV